MSTCGMNCCDTGPLQLKRPTEDLVKDRVCVGIEWVDRMGYLLELIIIVIIKSVFVYVCFLFTLPPPPAKSLCEMSPV